MSSCYFLYIPTDVVPLYPYTPGIVFLVCRGRGSLASHTHFRILRFAEYAEMGVACETRVEVQHLWECRSIYIIIYIYIYTARKTQRVATFVILLHPKQQELCLYIIWGRGRVCMWATKCQLFSDTFGSHNS